MACGTQSGYDSFPIAPVCARGKRARRGKTLGGSIGLTANLIATGVREAVSDASLDTKVMDRQLEVLRNFQPQTPHAPDLNGGIDVWRVQLDTLEPAAKSLERLLSPDEMKRADRFRFAQDRRRFVVARAVLRQLLGAYLGASPASLRFAYGPQGKPRLADAHYAQGHVTFNLSHSRELALLAVAKGCEIGVDLEAVRPLEEASAMARRIFSAAELAALAAMPEVERDMAFYRFWTRREAWVKALGTGLAEPPDRLDVTTADAGDAGEPDWRFVRIEPGEGYVGALAVPAGISLDVRGRLWLE
jgi:4'-phosphopantetheinyl transferase